ncbi:MAG: 2-oxoacid:acceptor oxidoreductase subunit alpha [Chloroflexi bacterium]|nr:2-oxoacid:acceptor oxidoreductase subunit alpha [Chloroflexota bacterium]
MPIDVNFMVGGEAGQGVQSVGFILAKAFTRGGYHVFVDQDYESRVRGGHNFYRVPLDSLAREKAGDKLMANTVALGAALGLVEYDLEILGQVLREHFGAGEIGESNVKAATAGYEYAQQSFKGDFEHRLRPISDTRRMLLTANEAIALGAIAAGCKFMAAYPMTPTSSIMEYLAAKARDLDLVMVHAEDEIAAVNMVIGASYAGVRAMTATSGSGFCLMVEGLGLAGITETPIVIINGQRPGPATGLPTRTEQSDLEFVLHASHGEFPRAILAPATIEDAFWLTIKAFNLAEKYQLPVILLTDQHLASSYATVEKFDLTRVNIDRGLLFSTESTGEEYKRHQITPSGISPRAFPGREGILVATDADEHNEAGHLIEDAETRTEMVQKRLRKLFSLKQEMAAPQLYGAKKAKTTLIGWGSTYGALREAVDILRQEKASVNLLHLNELWPFPAEVVADVLTGSHNSYVIENNATAQLARLIRAETGKKVSGSILKYDGRPFTPAYIAQEVRKEGC